MGRFRIDLGRACDDLCDVNDIQLSTAYLEGPGVSARSGSTAAD
jgi:hypothetical protein